MKPQPTEIRAIASCLRLKAFNDLKTLEIAEIRTQRLDALPATAISDSKFLNNRRNRLYVLRFFIVEGLPEDLRPTTAGMAGVYGARRNKVRNI